MDSLRVFIERGSNEDSEIDFKDAADEYLNVRSGSIKIKIEQVPHKVFTREGDNLKMTVHLTLREALLGFYKTFKHLDGHEVDLDRRDKTTKPGFVEKIPDEGMPKADYSGDFGTLIVTYVVDYPEKLDDKQKALFKEFFLF